VYVPALNTPLRALLVVIFGGVAFLGATGVYLLAIRGVEWWQQTTLQTESSIWMTLLHVVVGLVVIAPFLVFGLTHLITAWRRPNRVAVRLGVLVFVFGLITGVTGILLIKLEGLPQLPTDSLAYWTTFVAHAVAPVLAVIVYVWHRKAGPAIKWKWGYAWGGTVVAFTAGMVLMHSQNPRAWFAKGSPEGEKYFEPSRLRTADGKFISAETLMLDEYCLKCHQDAYETHQKSMHRFSSFNNPPYLFSVRETRRVAGIRASRWCAGCHDVVPFVSGQFDDPDYDMEKHPTASAAITCVVCHSISHINSKSGNADYTITAPELYPFTFSDNPILQYINNQLIKAKPELHKKTFLKPFHRTDEFCSVCHKVGLPQEVNHYKEFLRGQNHADSFHLSGVSGRGARSWYLPPVAKENCAACHMPLMESADQGARDFDGSGKRSIHSHRFIAANTGIPWLVNHPHKEAMLEEYKKFLSGGLDGKSPPLRIDIFGLKHLEEGKYEGVDAPLLGDQPLRPYLPTLEPGQSYLVEVVIRTLNIGHHFTQGTVDSNEVWVEFVAKSGGKVIAHNGYLRPTRISSPNGTGDSTVEEGAVDENAHFINVLMLDRRGNRIDRRNPQDIFTPLYDHQIPPGAANVVHYRLDLPKELPGPVELFARVRYRKFDLTYMEYVYGKGKAPVLPIVDLCADSVTLPVAGVTAAVPPQKSPIQPAWQRWNDYGIGCFLEGGPDGKKDGELGQAEKAFSRLLSDEFKDTPDAQAHGWLNLARVHLAYQGPERAAKAREALAKAAEAKAPWQTVAWFSGLLNFANADLPAAIKYFEQILDPANRDPKRKFDFTNDYVVINELGKALFQSAQDEADDARRREFLRQAIARFERTVQLDPENVVAHDYLAKSYARLGLAESGSTASETPSADLVAEAGRAAELVRSHRAAFAQYQAAEDVWTRLPLARAIVRYDEQLLNLLPDLSKTVANAKESKARRLQAAAQLQQALERLTRTPGQEDVVAPLLPGTVIPHPGLPSSLALTGAAYTGHLQGPLPPPRRLTLYAIQPAIHALYRETHDEELRRAAARILSRIHQVLHGIFKPDENAQGVAVQRYRERHPAAARASQSIVIYPTTVVGDLRASSAAAK
ncbi:MAG: cytochrome c family protein, partial [Gemmataceae bacterium]|nr:cytochrome c family protein [Gemmataceae bacterium]